MEMLQKEVAALREHLNSKITEATNSLEKSYTDKVDAQLKAEVKSLTELLGKKEDALNSAIDKLDAQVQKGLISLEDRNKKEATFESILGEQMGEERFKTAFRDGGKSSFLVDLTGKAVGTMTETDSLTGEVIAPTRRESIVELAQRPVHVRSLIPQGTMNSNLYRFVKETAGEGAADLTTEGSTKNQIDYDFAASDAPVNKITGFARVSEEMLDDIPALQGFLGRRLTKDIRKKEDQQLLYGTGAGGQFTGLNVAPTTFSAYAADTNATIIDLLIQVYATLETLFYEANGVLLNPKDYYQIYLAKNSEGSFLKQDLVTTLGGQLFIAGIPVFRNTAVNTGEYFVGDWLNGAQIFDRMGVNVQFSTEDGDNFTKNLVTVRAEERFSFPIFRPDSFVYGTLLTDINKIKSFT